MIIPSLERGGYAYKGQVLVGLRPGGRKHKVDALAEKQGKKYLVSLKWQQVGGTAEQKVPFEIISLAKAINEGEYHSAYLVLGGAGWTLRDFYIGGGLNDYLKNCEKVDIISLEEFVGKANRGEL
ncbi:hypothetical protein KW782_00270 [Candidatus Parcubacteria bacterium]|nr:hypothetical protein [Candidatus Parcubacteria bacterium]